MIARPEKRSACNYLATLLGYTRFLGNPSFHRFKNAELLPKRPQLASVSILGPQAGKSWLRAATVRQSRSAIQNVDLAARAAPTINLESISHALYTGITDSREREHGLNVTRVNKCQFASSMQHQTNEAFSGNSTISNQSVPWLVNLSSQVIVDSGNSSVESSHPKQPAQFESVRSTYRRNPLERQIRHPHLLITHRQYSSD